MTKQSIRFILCCAWFAMCVASPVNAIEPGEGHLEFPGGQVWYKVVGDGPGVPLLTLHGGPGVPSAYLNSLSALGNERPVIFYDQLGCGKSTHTTDTALWTIDYFVSELDSVRTRLGLQDVHLFGHSWGGILAAEYMRTQPTGVHSVIFCGPAFSTALWDKDVATLVQTLPDSVQRIISETAASGDYASPAFQFAVGSFYGQYLARKQPWSADIMTSVQTRNLAMTAYMMGMSPFAVTGSMAGYDCTGWLPNLKVPALLIAGDHDETLPPTLAIYDSLLPVSRAIIISESGHLPMHDNPAEHNRAIREFLGEVDE